MRPGLLLPIALLGIPILEIAVFIQVGSLIGLFPTLAMIFVTAVIGTSLLRYQGFSLLARIRAETEARRIPGAELGHGAMILVAGVLLLTPGFVTDTIGFLLFVPAIRSALWRFIARHVVVMEMGRGGPHGPGRRGPGDPVVDLDEEEWSRKSGDSETLLNNNRRLN
ncbi:FxsA family protein [Breoghania sp.]|uniref:FxsA family protein n=1 Tax=Breoghania sp. TaxID=2065378 RepID=UPI00261F2929|nr:FxsA family protein [Breoghania sp.]MDJ0933598.1 FxsA family protein [Breoghania sp.]